VISIRQKDIGINLRSTPATYLDIADAIRALFAKANHVAQAYFSFNSKGACPACQGKGVIISDMAYMDSFAKSATERGIRRKCCTISTREKILRKSWI
jgi:excinuclease UvrABC ATPase subunit